MSEVLAKRLSLTLTGELNFWVKRSGKSVSHIHGNHFFFNSTVIASIIIQIYTVEPRLTATSVIRSPRCYGKFFLARKNDLTFSLKQKNR